MNEKPKKRYIARQDLISRCKLFNACATAQDKAGVFQAIQQANTVEAVQVVHCRECEHYNGEIKWCDIHSHFVLPDGEFCRPDESAEWKMFDEEYFCADGKRKSE